MSAAEQQVAQEAAASSKKKTEYDTVTMSDGRQVQFPKNRKLQKESFITGVDGHTGETGVRLDFANGETRFVAIPGAAILLEDITSGEIDELGVKQAQHLLKAACHGYEQKLGDEMAYQKKADEAEPTLEDKIVWVDTLIDRLNGLEWNTTREGGGGLAGVGLLVQALIALSGKSKDEVRAILKPMSREEQAALKRHPPIKAKIDEIEAERAARSGVDVSSTLGNLGLA
jgi:hypothetical protein